MVATFRTRNGRRPAAAILAGALIGVAAVLVAPAPAFAHAALRGTVPTTGAYLAQAPDLVTMTFSDPPNPALARVVVRDAAGADLTEGPPTADGRTLVQRVRTATTGGTIAVSYRVVSADGHPIEGTFAFTLATAPSPGATTSAAAVPPAAVASETPEAGQPHNVNWAGAAFPIGLVLGGIGIAAAVAFWPRRPLAPDDRPGVQPGLQPGPALDESSGGRDVDQAAPRSGAGPA
ncbi:copper resistance CopC family protein [Dactylosporangium sp. NPDC005572]|uniref:copper resistance CopC family protein n=1 Tax=Dactylosporangium sp. NPDC005572 TaxID=3156889 RepID=UPI0033A6EE20